MDALRELARDCGILTEHIDGLGKEAVPPDRTLLALLHALGIELDTPADAAAVLAERRARPPELAPPAAVIEAGDADAGVPVALGEDEAIEARFALEDGSERRIEARGRDLRAGADGRRYLPVGAAPAGYHRLHVYAGDRQALCHVLAAPGACWGAPDGSRHWGVFAPVYALRSGDSLGAGDFGDLRRLMRYASERGARFAGTLPLLAADYERGEVSPYSPISRLFFNELFLDQRQLAAEVPAIGRALASEALQARAAELRALELVDYAGVSELVQPLLTAGRDAVWEEPAWRARIEAFLAERPEVDDYARFRAVLQREGRPWPEWPEAERAGDIARGAVPEDAWRYHVLAQLLLDEQLGGLDDTGAGLYLDLPVGVSGHSYDVWRYRDAFAEMVTVGAPPDGLFQGGQNWALPPLHPERARRRGHDYFISSIRAHMRRAAMLRVDHVMGLHRLYWVPAHAPATEGAYVTYPAEELYAILAIESHRHQCRVAGEDLGTVPDYVRPTMDRRGLHRLFVGQFCVTEGDDGPVVDTPPASAIASLDTHDTATFAAFAAEAELPGPPAERMRDWTLRLAESPAAAVLVTLEDLWLETEPQNKPGTTSEEYPSWRRKLRLDMDELESDPEVDELLREVDRRRR